MTVHDGHRRHITYNDYHAHSRQTSSIAHEIAHGLLMHEPAPALDVRGLVVHRSEIEDQATFMGAALLVPEEAALSIVARAVAFTEAASYYGVSLELLRWRINSTGAEPKGRSQPAVKGSAEAIQPVTGGSPRGNTPEAGDAGCRLGQPSKRPNLGPAKRWRTMHHIETVQRILASRNAAASLCP